MFVHSTVLYFCCFIPRLPSGSDRGAWYHEHFLRDEASKLELIKRTPIKGAIYTKSIERFNAFMKPPDFYAAAKLQQRPLQAGASDPASADGLSTSEMFMCDENGKEEPLELPTDGISNVPAPLQVPPRQVTMETEPEQLDLNMLSEQWQRFDIQLNAPNFSRYAPLVQNCNLQQQPLPFSDAAFQVLAQSLFPRPIRGTQTHAPLQHAACTADSFSQGVERRHGVPCLSSPVLEVGAAKMQSLGIDGHPRVERDNRDVSDAEFEAFLSDYF